VGKISFFEGFTPLFCINKNKMDGRIMRLTGRFARWLIKSINNISIKRKLITMYVLCVLIPILAVNTIFYLSVSNSVKEKELTVLKQSVDRIGTNFATSIEQCMRVYSTINSDNKINLMLDTIYEDPESYSSVYNENIKDAVGKYISVYNQLLQIDIFTKNNSIIDSSYFHVLDKGVLESKWYNKFSKSNSNTLIYAYIDDNPQSYYKDKRFLSVICKPYSYNSSFSANKIIKIDIRLNSLIDIINREKTEGTIYLVSDSNNIILSNNPSVYNNDKEFIDFNRSLHSSKDVVITKTFEQNGYLRGWKIIGVFPEKSIATSLKDSKISVTIVALISLVVATLVLFVISNSIKNRLEIVSRHLKGVAKENLDIIQYETGEDEIGELIRQYNKSTTRIKNLIEEVYESEIAKTKAELRALQSQVNPHFLYNTLNTLRLRSVLKGETETAEIIKYMAKLFRRLLAWEDDLVTVKEELALTKDFLEIQKYRYGNKLDYRINVEDSLMECKVPKMCIQTLVENSSVHGIERIEGEGMISIDIHMSEGKLHCIVSDNGIGIEEDRLEAVNNMLKQGKSIGDSYGTSNIYRRLKLYFGEEIDFNIHSELNKGTRVMFAVPINDKTKEAI
jgi:two-component system, sensor histidine kinase YesM